MTDGDVIAAFGIVMERVITKCGVALASRIGTERTLTLERVVKGIVAAILTFRAQRGREPECAENESNEYKTAPQTRATNGISYEWSCRFHNMLALLFIDC